MRLIALALVVGLMSVAQANAADPPGFLSQKGQWILNKAESKIPAGEPAPPETPMVVSDDDGNKLKYIVYIMTPAGLQPGRNYEGAYDGEPYPYGKDGTRSYKHLTPYSFRTDWKGVDGQSASETVTFSANLSKMRVEGKGIDQGGKTYDYVQVWERLQ